MRERERVREDNDYSMCCVFRCVAAVERCHTTSLPHRSWSSRFSSGGALSSALPVPVWTSTPLASL